MNGLLIASKQEVMSIIKKAFPFQHPHASPLIDTISFGNGTDQTTFQSVLLKLYDLYKYHQKQLK